MAREINSKCRKCRRAMEKLFLKGDRCASSKCAIVRKNYAPGMHGKKITRGRSEYGVQLAAKQKIRRIYGVLEKQFRKHFSEVKGKKGITGDLLLMRLEMRLDNIIYKIGFGSSRSQARQLVSHGFFTVNGKKANIPSMKIKAGDLIKVNDSKTGKNNIKMLQAVLKNKKDIPGWLDFDPEKMDCKIIREPEISEVGVNVDAQMVVEYYSR